MGLSRKKEILLFQALKDGGTISTQKANRLYSGSNGKDALISMEFEGYLENKGFGNFKVVRAPDEVIERYKQWQKSGEDNEASQSSNLVDESGNPVDQEAGGGSGYEIQQVN